MALVPSGTRAIFVSVRGDGNRVRPALHLSCGEIVPGFGLLRVIRGTISPQLIEAELVGPMLGSVVEKMRAVGQEPA